MFIAVIIQGLLNSGGVACENGPTITLTGFHADDDMPLLKAFSFLVLRWTINMALLSEFK